jgi:hypothetical protein
MEARIKQSDNKTARKETTMKNMREDTGERRKERGKVEDRKKTEMESRDESQQKGNAMDRESGAN